MKQELLTKLLNELISYNERCALDYTADGNIPMQQYCRGKLDAYKTILEAVS